MTETGCPGPVAGFGADTGPVGELRSLCGVRPSSCSSVQRPRCWFKRVLPQVPWCLRWHSWGRAKQRAKCRARLRGSVPAVPPGQPRERPAPRHANPTAEPDPTPPNRCQVPPRIPKQLWFRSCVSPESTFVVSGGATFRNLLFWGVLFPRGVARTARIAGESFTSARRRIGMLRSRRSGTAE